MTQTVDGNSSLLTKSAKYMLQKSGLARLTITGVLWVAVPLLKGADAGTAISTVHA